MPNINLRPWREERRKQRNQQFVLTLILFLAVVGAGAFFWVQMNANDISKQQQRNQFLQSQIRILDQRIVEIRGLQDELRQLQERMDVIQQLQINRPIPVRIFDELVVALPDGIFFENMQLRGSNLTIQGVSDRAANISDLLRNLEASEWFSGAFIRRQDAIMGASGQVGDRFNVVVRVHLPRTSEDQP